MKKIKRVKCKDNVYEVNNYKQWMALSKEEKMNTRIKSVNFGKFLCSGETKAIEEYSFYLHNRVQNRVDTDPKFKEALLDLYNDIEHELGRDENKNNLNKMN